MELNEIREIITQNQRCITQINEWAQATEKRVTQLETANDILTVIQVTLKELSMESRYFGKQLEELKQSIDKSNDENKKQHVELQAQITTIKDKPGVSWDKAKWVIISGVLSAATAFGIAKLLMQ